MTEFLFDSEGIKFKYTDNWGEQRKDVIGPDCIKALFKVEDGNPATINVYKKDAGNNEFVADLEDSITRNFKTQGWDIVESKILNLNGKAVINVIANVEEGKKIYSRLLKNGISSDRIILIPRRFTCEPTPKQLAEIARGKPFQSPACLTGCKRPEEFCSVSWDKKVNWCSYAGEKQPLKELTYNGLMEALNKVEFRSCK